jgi:hypothetical protein
LVYLGLDVQGEMEDRMKISTKGDVEHQFERNELLLDTTFSYQILMTGFKEENFL